MVAAIRRAGRPRLFMRGARVVGRKVQHREAGLGRSPAQGLEDFLLVAEVVVDKGLGHAQRRQDLLDGGVGIAIAIEQGFGGLEECARASRRSLPWADAGGRAVPRGQPAFWRSFWMGRT